MRIKLKRKSKSPLMELVPMSLPEEVEAVSKQLEEIGFAEPIMRGADCLGLSPEVLVEMFITKTYPRAVKRTIFNINGLFHELVKLESDSTLREMVIRKNYVLSAKERRDVENAYVTERVLRESKGIVDSLVKCAKGFEYEKYSDKLGDTVTVDMPPSVDAARYLLDRALGKPVAVTEGDGKSGGGGAHVQIFLPANGRNDGPSGPVIEYDDIMRNAGIVEEDSK